MFEVLRFFRSHKGTLGLALPLDVNTVIADWSGLRAHMVREKPAAFTRDEWAYLIAFLSENNLHLPFHTVFGNVVSEHEQTQCLTTLVRPRGNVALWLPNNVSLLGPLVLILVSLTGQSLRIKAGSRSENLTAEWLSFALSKLPVGALRNLLSYQVSCEVFDRKDPRNAAMAIWAQIRIIFGSDASAVAIHALPHPLESIGFSFVDRRSEAWVQESMLHDDQLLTLLRVFSVYGQTACTSPRRVVLLDQDIKSAQRLRDRLIKLSHRVISQIPPVHIASSNVMASQWAAALGWNARLSEHHSAVFACGTSELPLCSAPMLLSVVAATVEEAVATLPKNIQTIGYALEDPGADKWLLMLARSSVKRFVPIHYMHHFSSQWDGWDFWHQLFEEVEIKL